MKNKSLLLLFTVVLFTLTPSSSVKAQTLIAGWDFQTLPGTVIQSFPNTQNVFNANFGNGTLYLDGTMGSSSWPQFNRVGIGGTTMNAAPGFSLDTNNPSALRLTYFNGFGNNQYLSFSINMSGYQDLVISYAAERNNGGFTSHSWEYSADNGNTWIPFHTINSLTIGSYSTIIIPTLAALDNNPNALVRFKVNGATQTTGINQIDNIQFNANVIPEPSTIFLTTIGILITLLAVRRQKARQA